MNTTKLIIKVLLLLLLLSCTTKGKETTSTISGVDTTENELPEILTEEDRNIDEDNPPIILDIIEARKTIENIKVSQFAKSLHYIKLSHPFDSDFLEKAKIRLTKHGLVAKVEDGIALFDEEGNFVEMVCRDGAKYVKTKEGYTFITPEILDKYIGSVGEPIIVGDKIYYKYVDVPQKKGQLIEYIPDYDSSASTGLNNDSIISKPKGKAVVSVEAVYSRDDVAVAAGSNSFIQSHSKSNSLESGNFLTLSSWQGDTIWQFKDYDRDFKITGTYRNPEQTTLCKSTDGLLVRQCYNDTIYKLILPNRLQPKYIIDLGEKGIKSAQEGLSPAIGLENRYVVADIKDLNDFLLLLYTQDYSCPNTAKQKTLKYNLYIFDKKEKRGYHAYIDAEPYIPPIPKNSPIPASWPQAPLKGIKNDIDGGEISWSKIMHTADGKIYAVLNGSDFKKDSNKNSESIDSLANSCYDDDIVIAVFE